MSAQQRVSAAADLPPGKVVGAGRYAVGNAGGRYFAVTRRCRHLGADLAGGSIDEHGCQVCPWHHSAYDITTGRWSGDRRGSSPRCLAWTSGTGCSPGCCRWGGRR